MEATGLNNQSTIQAPQNSRGQGCGFILLFVLAIGWIVSGTGTVLFLNWTIEQTLFEGSLEMPDLRWVAVLVFALVQAAPFLIAFLVIKDQNQKAIYRTFFWASLFALLMVPARFFFVEQYQWVMVVQGMGGLLFIALFEMLVGRRAHRHDRGSARPRWEKLALAAGLGVALLLPWSILGALGSPFDLLVGVFNSLVFGAAAARLMAVSYFSARSDRPAPVRVMDILLDGLVAFLMLLIMVSGVAQNGNELIMALVVPAAGWVLAMLYPRQSRDEAQAPSWAPGALWLALVAAWPLLWFDPDELMLIVGMGWREPVGLSSLAAFATLGLILLATILMLVFRRRVISREGPLWAYVALLAVAVFTGAACYVFAGKPGWYGERLFVLLKDQADVSQAATIEDVTERRTFVYQNLVSHARETQSNLWQIFDRIGVEYTPYYLANAIEVDGGPLVRLWLTTRPEVDRVLANPILRPLPWPVQPSRGKSEPPSGPEWNLVSIEADRAWHLGVTGKGVVVGQSDSGVQGDHSEVQDSYRGRQMGGDYNWLDPWGHTPDPVDIGGHGTHTLGSILGNRVGVAPDAEWIGCVNLARNLGNPARYLDCMQFMLAPFPQQGDPFEDGDAARGANVLNNSWGCPTVEGCDPGTFLSAMKALRAAGVFVVVSAGNSGYSGCGSIDAPPAIYDEVYTVGAVNAEGNRAEFSSLGPVTVDGSNRQKPDILAPGEDVLSSFPGSTYEISSGTSMAGPHVVGVVALMWSANPGLIGKIDRTIEILNASASSYQGEEITCGDQTTIPNNVYGHGVVNAYEAVKMALEDSQAHGLETRPVLGLR